MFQNRRSVKFLCLFRVSSNKIRIRIRGIQYRTINLRLVRFSIHDDQFWYEAYKLFMDLARVSWMKFPQQVRLLNLNFNIYFRAILQSRNNKNGGKITLKYYVEIQVNSDVLWKLHFQKLTILYGKSKMLQICTLILYVGIVFTLSAHSLK